MKSLLQRSKNGQLKIQSLVMPKRPIQTPEEWQYEIKKRLRDLRLGN